MSVEIANLMDSMVSFVAGAVNPILILSRTDNIESVSRVAQGQYRVSLLATIPPGALLAPDTQLRAVSNATFASFAAAYEDVGSPGDVIVEARNLAGALTDTGARIDLTVLRYPTQV